MRRGDIYVAAVRGAYTGKPRAVVIVQDDRLDATAWVTVCPLTANPVWAPLTRILVEPTAATGIESRCRGANLRDRLGRLADADVVRLDRALIVFLGLAE